MDAGRAWAEHEAVKWLFKRVLVYLLAALLAAAVFFAVAPFLL